MADLQVRLGDHDKAIPELLRLTREHPIRERLSESLMRALYHAGRQVDALAEYRRFSTRLRQELGLDPVQSMRHLHCLILNGDIEQAPDVSIQTSNTPVPRQLPAETIGFTGRKAELSELQGLLPDKDGRTAGQPTSIVAIEGTAGVGKTALAIRFALRVADRFPDGSIYLNLRGHGPGEPMDTATALAALLGSLGVPGDHAPSDIESRAAFWRSHTAGRRIIVLLDNASSSAQLRPLLPGSGCLAVATTRTQLSGLGARDGAHRIPLRRLDQDDAMELLAGVLGAHRLQAEPEAGRQLVEHCAYLPLAIRILAERARSEVGLSLADIVESLHAEGDALDPFTLDDGVETDLRAVFSHSYDAVDADAARLFRLISQHPGNDFSTGVAAAAAGITVPEALALLRRLTSAHLLERYAPGRFRFHDLLRAYAEETARRVDGEDALRSATLRMLDWYLHSTTNAAGTLNQDREILLLGPPPSDIHPIVFGTTREALAWCDSERSNLVAAVVHAEKTHSFRHAWQITWTLVAYFNLRPHMDDWLAAQRIAATAAIRLDDHKAQGFTDFGLGLANMKLQNHQAAVECHRRALAAFELVGDLRWATSVLVNLTIALQRAGTHGDSRKCGEKALSLARAIAMPRLEGSALQALSFTYLKLDHHREALASAQLAISIQQSLGNIDYEALALRNLGMIYAALDQYPEAANAYRRTAALHHEVGAPYDAAVALVDLGNLCHDQGDTDGAHDAWHEAHALFAELRHPAADGVSAKLRSLEQPRSGVLPS